MLNAIAQVENPIKTTARELNNKGRLNFFQASPKIKHIKKCQKITKAKGIIA